MPNSGMYRMSVVTTGIQGKAEETRSVLIPSGALVYVKGSSRNDGFLDCIWRGADIAVLALDIHERATRVKSVSK